MVCHCSQTVDLLTDYHMSFWEGVVVGGRRVTGQWPEKNNGLEKISAAIHEHGWKRRQPDLTAHCLHRSLPDSVASGNPKRMAILFPKPILRQLFATCLRLLTVTVGIQDGVMVAITVLALCQHGDGEGMRKLDLDVSSYD